MEKKLSNEEIASVYHLYAGKPLVKHTCDRCPFVFSGTIPKDFCTKNYYQGELVPVLYGDWSGGTNPELSAYGQCSWDEIKLLLTPLSAISDEDAVELAKILRSPHAIYHLSDKRNMIDSVKYWIEHGLIAVFSSHAWKIYQAFQYLISKGYAVPLWFGIDHWANGKTAIELGIAIDKTIAA